MVSQHFKLREQPFGVTPDPKYLYASASHREALASLLYGLQSGLGFVALIAKPGMGKTTLLFDVLRRLRDTRTTVFLFQTITTPVDLLRAILIDLGIKDVRESLVDLQTQLNKVLLNQSAAHKSVVVVIDEAQNLNDAVLETVRMLSNFETASQKLMQIILAGQPQLAEKLMTPELLQLRQRISIFAHLTPLSMTETAAYIIHRLRFAGLGREASIFTPSAVALIAQHSEGIPRNINNLCFNSMSLAFALKRTEIDSEIVDEVISDLNVREHLRAAETYRFDPSERTPLTTSSKEEATSVENSTGESYVSGPIELPTASLPELQTSKPWQPVLKEYPPLAVNFPDVVQVPEPTFVPDLPSVYDPSTASANTYQVAKIAVEHTIRVDDHSTLPVFEPLLPPSNDRLEPQVRARWSEQEIPDHNPHHNDHSLHTASNPRSTVAGDESTPNDSVLLGKPIFATFEGRSRWRSGRESWNHTAIVATVAGLALCIWLGFVDYKILYPKGAIEASSRATAPVSSTNDGQSTDQSESVPSTTPQHRGSIRVKKVESLATLCNRIYGECSPDLMEQLLVLNPSILYPNRLHPGQVISIPLDTHNAKTER
jgi:type II secretory pathway predicted ATPase ExeA